MSRYEEAEDCNEDPCVRLFFTGCFLLLPREKEKPDTQGKVFLAIVFNVNNGNIFNRNRLVLKVVVSEHTAEAQYPRACGRNNKMNRILKVSILFNREAAGVRGLWFTFGLLTTQPQTCAVYG